MARYDYELRYRWGARPRSRRGRAARPPRRAWRGMRSTPGPAYGEEYRIRARMGMHDFGEHYGRYSGGSPYDYEYSERTIQHEHPRPEEDIGFTRTLHEDSGRRFPMHGRSPERRRGRREW
ncbi:MAG TPA: hypothetical protein VF212_04815 [Longimicrobiales bacterium]